MDIVGEKMKNGDMFIPEVSALLLKTCQKNKKFEVCLEIRNLE